MQSKHESLFRQKMTAWSYYTLLYKQNVQPIVIKCIEKAAVEPRSNTLVLVFKVFLVANNRIQTIQILQHD